MGRKSRGCCAPFWEGSRVPIKAQCRLAESYLVVAERLDGSECHWVGLIRPAVRPQQTWAENWGLCLFFVGNSVADLEGGRAGSGPPFGRRTDAVTVLLISEQ